MKELKVTSCTGPGLHGDQMLALISRCCDRVTRVDVSWSGATDTGVKALSDGRSESVQTQTQNIGSLDIVYLILCILK